MHAFYQQKCRSFKKRNTSFKTLIPILFPLVIKNGEKIQKRTRNEAENQKTQEEKRAQKKMTRPPFLSLDKTFILKLLIQFQ